MRRASILAVAASSVVLLTVAAFGAMRWATTSTDRPDCPGKIVCPLTGELICRDQCPTVDPNRPDCPGRIECPQTGELICVDKCPLGAKAKSQTKSCCGACCEKQK
ncbi:MAG: hypothetical protein HBSAPP02_28480 [Phycisphaerae bacterium]|nr:MAG: hypothetical protein HBSAPP02_28480 [Phycisphaerae bacterium]